MRGFRKTISFIATIATLLNSLGAPLTVIAQEITPEPTPVPTEEPLTTPTTEPTIAPTEEPTTTPESTSTEIATPTPGATVEPTPIATDLVTPAPDTTQPETQNTTSENTQSQAPPSESPTVTPSATPEVPQEHGDLTITTIEEVDLSQVTQLNANVDGNSNITTDKADYHPTDVVLISGTGFTPHKAYTLEIVSTDEPPSNFEDQIKADETGNFSYAYQLDGNYRPNYAIYVKTGENIVAFTTFTDSIATDIDQCQNGGVGDPLQPCNESDFPASSGYGYEGNANANGNNSHWNEGDFVPLRIVGTDYSVGAGNIQFSIDITKSGKHAYDYIGSFDATETTGASSSINANHNNPVTDVIPGALPTAPDSLGTVPAATLSPFPVACGTNSFVGSQIAGQVKAWGTSGPLTVTYVNQNVGSSDCTTTIQVAWTATQPSFGGTIVIAYGAHIAKQTDWGTGNSAISIPGSPYHTSLVQYSSGGETKVIGQQDAKLAANAVIVPGTINIIKNTVGGNGTFNYTATGNGLSNFAIATSANTGNQSFTNLIPGSDGGSRTITEAVPAGWSLTGLSCVSVNQTSTVSTNLASGLATISSLGAGDTVNCTYTNTIQNGHIIVDKVTNPSGSLQSFSFDATGGSYSDFNLTDQAAPNDQALQPGNYSVAETAPTGWDLATPVCVSSIQDIEVAGNLELDPNETITCTFTNTQRGHIIVDKVTDPSGDPQSFTFTPSYGSSFGLTDADTPNDSGALVPGTYSVSESVPAGWDLTSATCTDGSDPSSIGLAAGETVTCTFNNQKDAKIIVAKVTNPTGNQTSFEFDPSWTSNFFLSDGQSNDSGDLNPGTYSVSEIVPLLGWDLTSATCSDQSPVNSISLQAGETITCTFTNTQRGSISGYKYEDRDGDGVNDPDWTPVTGWVIELWQGQTQIGQTQTDANGYYSFTNLLQGAYQLIEQVLGGWTNVTPTTINVTLTPGESDTGNNFVNTRYGTIVVEKQTIPNDSTQVFDFDLSFGDGDADLSDGQQDSTGNLLPGPYSVSETALAGWDLTSTVCTSSIQDTESAGSLELDSGETITCVFTNTQRGHIIVDKVTDPSGDPQSFTFTPSYGGPFGLTDADTPNDSGALVPGTYSVSETVPPGWDLTSATCTDGSDPSSIGLAAGETVTCTFNNQKDSGIVVIKQTIPDGSLENFEFDSEYHNENFLLTDGFFDLSGDLVPGTYSVTELSETGWDLTSTICSDQSPVSAISLQSGETVTCTFTNTQKGHLIVQKTTVPTADSQVFSINATGSGTITGGGAGTVTDALDKNYEVTPGTYSVTENEPSNWIETSNNCTNVEVSAGETEYCQIVNTKKGNVTVVKYHDRNANGVKDIGDEVLGDTGVGAEIEATRWEIHLVGTNVNASQWTGAQVTGQVTFSDINPGVYTLSESIKAGWTQSNVSCAGDAGVDNDNSHSVTVNAGQTTNCEIGNYQNGSIAGTKFEDLDGTTVTSGDQYGILNWVIELYTCASDFTGCVLSTTDNTDSSGDYGFINLLPGYYQVQEILQTGWYNLTTLFHNVTITSGDAITDKDFVNTEYATIIVEKQTLPDGSQQAFEFDSSWGPNFFLSDNQSTSSGNLTPGTYSVAEITPEGWDLTDSSCSNEDDPSSVTLESGETVTCIFTNTQRGRIVVDKITDPAADPQSFDFVATGSGYVNFSLTDAATPNDQEVVPGNYAVSETLPTGWDFIDTTCLSSKDDSETADDLSVDPGETITCTFTNQKDANIVVVKETNPDEYEGSFEFETDYSENFFLSDGQSDDSGDLDPGTYSVSEILPLSGWDLTSVICSDESDPSSIGLSAGETVTCTFTNTKLTDIHGYKWNDENGNGIRDCGFESDNILVDVRIGCEPLLSGWTVFIDENENGELDGEEQSTQTEDTFEHYGWYLFSNLVPGTYRICEVPQNGWVQTSIPTCHTVELPQGELSCSVPDQINATENATGTCNFGNQETTFDLNIEKSNDKSGGASAGDTVKYTLVVTNNGNQNIYNLDVMDSLPGGFTYITGSTTGDTSANPATAGNNLTWNDVDSVFEPGETFTIQYQVKIDSGVSDGTYKNFATCRGETEGLFFLAALIEGPPNPETIDCNVDDSDVQIGRGLSFGGNLGQVLGISTELPATGNPTALLLVALGLIGTGFILKKKYVKN